VAKGYWGRGRTASACSQRFKHHIAKKCRVMLPLPRFSLWSSHWAMTTNAFAQAANQSSCPPIQSCAMTTVSWLLATECFILWSIWRVISACEVTLGKDRIR
jgi:hypothetical protein